MELQRPALWNWGRCSRQTTSSTGHWACDRSGSPGRGRCPGSFHIRTAGNNGCLGGRGCGVCVPVLQKISRQPDGCCRWRALAGDDWAYWAYSTDAIYVPVAAMFAGAALASFMNGPDRVFAMVAGCMAGFAILAWEANRLSDSLNVAGHPAAPACRRQRLSTSSWFLAACAVPVRQPLRNCCVRQGCRESRGLSSMDHLSRLRYRASDVGATDDGSSG